MKKLLVSTLVLAFAVAPAMAKDIEKSFEVSVGETFQMVGDLGTTEKAGGVTTKTKPDIFFQNADFTFGVEAEYGILGLEFGTIVEEDKGGDTTIGLDAASASLNFMDAIALSMGHVGMPTRGDDQDTTMGINSFLSGVGDDVGDLGIKLSGAVAGGLFEYALTLTNGYQPGKSGTVSSVYGPAVGVQLRFNVLGGEDTGGDDYFLGEKSALTIGTSFVYQQLPKGEKYVKFKGTTADQQNLMFFDVFVQGDVALGDNSLSLPFMLMYEHYGFDPKSGKGDFSDYSLADYGDLQTASLRPLGTFTAGVGFYVGGQFKIMPAIRYSVDLFQNDKTVSGIDSLMTHNLEASFGYFPYGGDLNLKIAYQFKSINVKSTVSGSDISMQDHKLIAQVGMNVSFDLAEKKPEPKNPSDDA